MRELKTRVYSADPRQATNTQEAFTRNLKAVRSQSSPALAVVSNFDPDQRGFVTNTLQGYTMLQQRVGVSTTGRMAVNADYNRIPPGQTGPMRPEPGQPNLIYPVGSGSGGSSNLAFIKGGKVDYKRSYPAKGLMRNHRSWTRDETRGDEGVSLYSSEGTVVAAPSAVALDTGFISMDFVVWSENSPLPPGLRYLEFNDLQGAAFSAVNGPAELAGKTIADFAAPGFTSSSDPFTDFNSLLPHAYFVSPTDQGVIRTNSKPLPSTAWYFLNEVYQDDSYWTGEVPDPLNWQDDYWDGLDRDPTGKTPRVDRTAMETWLVDHPKARIHS